VPGRPVQSLVKIGEDLVKFWVWGLKNSRLFLPHRIVRLPYRTVRCTLDSLALCTGKSGAGPVLGACTGESGRLHQIVRWYRTVRCLPPESPVRPGQQPFLQCFHSRVFCVTLV
jgi:hypothetical protein